MKLLTELNESVEFLAEKTQAGAEKKYTIKGIFMQGNKKNKNGRIYPTNVLGEGVNKYIQEYVSKNRALSELGHPESPTVNLDRVSHMITSLVQEGDNFMGVAKVMSTPMGKVVKSFIDEGVMLGVSSRALGSLRESNDGTKIVQPDFMLHAVDVVHDPSAPEAFVENMMEGVDWIMDAKTKQWIPQYMDKVLKPSLKHMGGKSRKDVTAKLFEDFIKRL